MTAALELASNQVTHFYSEKKNTDEMIKMADLLVDKYCECSKIWLSWDAASWHISKRLNQHLGSVNEKAVLNGGPILATAPLPAGAQFLNVIESVFSGLARNVIHHSDYRSADEANTQLINTLKAETCTICATPSGQARRYGARSESPAVLMMLTTARTPDTDSRTETACHPLSILPLDQAGFGWGGLWSGVDGTSVALIRHDLVAAMGPIAVP